jgi:hypothetical protein
VGDVRAEDGNGGIGHVSEQQCNKADENCTGSSCKAAAPGQ